MPQGVTQQMAVQAEVRVRLLQMVTTMSMVREQPPEIRMLTLAEATIARRRQQQRQQQRTSKLNVIHQAITNKEVQEVVAILRLQLQEMVGQINSY